MTVYNKMQQYVASFKAMKQLKINKVVFADSLLTNRVSSSYEGKP